MDLVSVILNLLFVFAIAITVLVLKLIGFSSIVAAIAGITVGPAIVLLLLWGFETEIPKLSSRNPGAICV